MSDMIDGIPVLDAHFDGPNIVVWCPECLSYHKHGNPDDKSPTHRLAHCKYWPKGYFLRRINQEPKP